MLVKSPGFSATVVLTLAICLGANAAIFTVVHDVLLRPLPLADPDRIVAMGDIYPTITPNDILSNDTPSYFDRLEALTTLEEQGLFTFWFDTLTVDGVPQEVRGIRATPSLFRVLQVPPLLGRTFTDAEGETGNDQKIILSYALWQRLFGGDPNVVGRPLRLAWNGGLYTIVGVMPREFRFFDQGYGGHADGMQGVQFWIPLAFTPEQKSDAARTRYGFFHVGRLRPGATVEQVQAQLDALHAANVKRFPQFRYAELGMYSAVTPLQEALTRPIRRTLYLLWAGAGVVLLIGAFNVANLTLARANARRRELATRVALGAGRLQVARQLLIEALLPAVLGGAGGLAVGASDSRGARGQRRPRRSPERDGCAIAHRHGYRRLRRRARRWECSSVWCRRCRPVPVTIPQALGDGSRSGTAGTAARFFRRGLVVAQVALSVVLLIGATLLFTSFRNLLKLDAGFDPTGVVTATIFPPPSRYPTPASVVALQDRVLDRVRAIPGVSLAGMTSNIALSGFENPSSVSAAGRTEDEAVIPSVVTVTPGYFEVLSTPLDSRPLLQPGGPERQLRRSRSWMSAWPRRLWPNEDPIGKSIYRGEAGPFTIAGVVRGCAPRRAGVRCSRSERPTSRTRSRRP